MRELERLTPDQLHELRQAAIETCGQHINAHLYQNRELELRQSNLAFRLGEQCKAEWNARLAAAVAALKAARTRDGKLVPLIPESGRVQEILYAIRIHPTLGRGSCSSLDETYTDEELEAQVQEELNVALTSAWAPYADVETALLFWLEAESDFWARGGPRTF